MDYTLKFRQVIGAICIFIICVAASTKSSKNVLIVGDSISIGYTKFIKEALAPAVNVEHNLGNGGSTIRGVDSIENWISDIKWDVVVFNFGLHDMIYKDALKKYNVENGKVAVSLEDYRKNLQVIINKLRETTAKLVFVNTTVVPEGTSGRKIESPEQYNKIAQEVMKTNQIEIIDLYKTSLTVHPQNSKQGNVHYTDMGYELLAQPIISKLKSILKN